MALHTTDRLRAIAFDWEQDRSFERDEEFFDDEKAPLQSPSPVQGHNKLPKERNSKAEAIKKHSVKWSKVHLELPEINAKISPRSESSSSLSPRARSKQLAYSQQLLLKSSGAKANDRHQAETTWQRTPAADGDGRAAAATYFNPMVQVWSPIQRSTQDARVFFQYSGHPANWKMQQQIIEPHMIPPVSHTMPSRNQSPGFQTLPSTHVPTPYEAIMAEMFRGQVARDMAMMADMARLQAEYWSNFGQWY